MLIRQSKLHLHLNDIIQVCLAEARDAAAVVYSDQYDVIDMACVACHVGIFLDILDRPLRTVIDNLHVSGQVPQLLISGGQRPHHGLSEKPRCVKAEEFEEKP